MNNESKNGHTERIKRYYDTSQKYYEIVWNFLNLHYGFWEEGVKTRGVAIEAENQYLANLAQINVGDIVLDLGSGLGGMRESLEKRGAKAISLNLSGSQLRSEGVRLNREGIGLVQADYHKIPFENNSVNSIVSVESIEHAYNTKELIREMSRVVKEDRRVVIAGTFKGRKPTDEEQRMLDVGYRAAGCFGDFKTAEEVVEMLEEQGMEVEVRDMTDLVMKSAKQMEIMCKLGLPLARWKNKKPMARKFINMVGKMIGKSDEEIQTVCETMLEMVEEGVYKVPDNMVDNTEWGTYQRKLMESGVTSYNVIVARKPVESDKINS